MKIAKTSGFETKSYSFLTTPIENIDCEVTLDIGSKTGTQMTQSEKNCERRICSIENIPFLKYVTLCPAVQLKSMF
jgi:hypothetical protein